MSDSVVKHRKGKTLKSGERQLIRNVYNSVKEQNPNITVKNIAKTVAKNTGIGVASVFRVLRDFKENGKSVTPSKNRKKSKAFEKVDDFTKTAIRRKVHDFYFRNEIPTINKVLKSVNEDCDLPDFTRTTFYRILKSLNFNFVSREKNSFLIERDDIILWRRDYLNSVKRYRSENRKIYYLDETWVNAGHTKKKIWVDSTIQSSKQAFMEGLSTGLKTPSGKGKRLIVTHIGSDTGFLTSGLWVFESGSTREYHEEMTGDAFLEWFSKILKLVEAGSVIVMDNAPYHSVRMEKIPNKASRKNEITEWLNSKGMQCHGSQLKLELLRMVQKVKPKYNLFKVDELAKKHNCTVLRLPPYHCSLNPIELVWAQVKGYVAENNKTFKLAEVKNLLETGVSRITADMWKKCINHVEEEEKRMWDLDFVSESVIEQFVINLNDDSSSSEDEILSGVEELQ
jgi:transposase